MKIFAASLMAMKQETIRELNGTTVRQTGSHAVHVKTCDTEEEALGHFYKKAKELFPSDMGYQNWDVAIFEVGTLT